MQTVFLHFVEGILTIGWIAYLMNCYSFLQRSLFLCRPAFVTIGENLNDNWKTSFVYFITSFFLMTAPTIKLVNGLGEDIVDFNIYKSNKKLKDGELLITLNQSTKTFSMNLITHKSTSKKVAAHKGEMKVIF